MTHANHPFILRNLKVFLFPLTRTMNGQHRVSAVIFDLDGTLLNTEVVNEEILKEVLVRYGKVMDMEKEKNKVGMSHRDSTIATVKDYHLPITPQQLSHIITPMFHHKWLQAKPLPGVNRLMKHLHKHGVPFALASNSRSKSIEIKLSSQRGWREYFSTIIAGDQVKSGKPSPDLFLEAANKMGVDSSSCLVIEDSIVGVKAGKAANMQVVAIPSTQSESDQFLIADYVIHSFLDFQPELWGLPPFEDWVMKALPIEQIHFRGSYLNGFLHEISDIGVYLSGQVWGIFFGWVDVDSQKRFKIVVSIRWDHSRGSFRRNIIGALGLHFIANGSNSKLV
uniref:bifunctional riboflavin kinase/FMN phosphatase-like isoform X2 n=1 Tax=Erigeron canadensis TaxID=72917 RepID=UPI001CB9BE4E|nr:bifunctional riboflavin kinase/FMN phosphatase-like isoform X2 [Erigeron canadensis]